MCTFSKVDAKCWDIASTHPKLRSFCAISKQLITKSDRKMIYSKKLLLKVIKMADEIKNLEGKQKKIKQKTVKMRIASNICETIQHPTYLL